MYLSSLNLGWFPGFTVPGLHRSEVLKIMFSSDLVLGLLLMDFGSVLDHLFHVFSCLLHHFFEHDFHMDFSLILARLLHGSREGRPCFFANSPSIIVVL